MTRRTAPATYTRRRDEWTGRYVIDFAYSLGCMSALDDEMALPTLREVIKECARNRAAHLGLLDQFRMGMRHERARG